MTYQSYPHIISKITPSAVPEASSPATAQPLLPDSAVNVSSNAIME